MPDYFLGVDLGKTGDPTALALVKRQLILTADGKPRRNKNERPVFQLTCVGIHRYPLMTRYTDIAEDIRRRLSLPALATHRPRLVVDATGVGVSVVEVFENAHMPCPMFAVTITGGENTRVARFMPRSEIVGFWVPKAELVSAVQAGLQTETLKIVPGLKDKETGTDYSELAKRELLEFRAKITAAAHTTYNAREGAHDDVVLALAMSAWLANHRRMEYEIPKDALDAETAAEREATAKQEAEDLAKQEREWRNPLADHWYQ